MFKSFFVTKAVDYLIKKARAALKEEDPKHKELLEEIEDLTKRVEKLERSSVKKKPGFFS